MGNDTLTLNRKVEQTGDKAAAEAAALEKWEGRRFELVKSAIGGLALNQLDKPGNVARNAVVLADCCIAELRAK